MTLWLDRYRTWLRWQRWGLGVYAILTGTAMIWGNDVRMSGPSYTEATRFAQFIGASPAILWGSTIIVCGVFAVLPRRPLCIVGLWGIAAWSVLFAVSWLLSVNTVPLAGVTGVFTHTLIAIMATGLIIVRLLDRGSR